MNTKFTFRLSALLLVLIMIFALPACTPPADGTVTGDTTTEAVTTAPPTYIDVLKDGKTEYVIIRAEKASSAVISAAVSINEKVGSSIDFGRFKMNDDFIGRNQELPETAKEIVVGVTNRKECAELGTLMAEKDYGVFYKNERIFIYGETDSAVEKAVAYFLEKYFVDGNIIIADNTADIVRFNYQFSSVKLNGENIDNYRVVIPDGADLLTQYAADNFVNKLATVCGRRLEIVKDTEAETECEILIGKTNRAASKAVEGVSCPDGSYILCRSGKKYVSTGNGYMVGGGVAALITKHMTGTGDINVTDVPETAAPVEYKFDATAKNAILMIGDGMGENHINATLAKGLAYFAPRQLPNIGWAITKSASYPKVTDSAASATALSSGYKTINGYLGMNPVGKSQQNVRELAQSVGAKTAVLTTDKITGATPGGFLVHVKSRNSTSEIQAQIDKLIADGKVNYCEGDVGDKLTEKVEAALYGMADGESRFFAMVEAALIDKRAHSNDLTQVIAMVKRYNDVTSYVIEFALFHPDTALIITADHETGGIEYNQSTGQYYFTSGDHTHDNVPVHAIGGGTEKFKGATVDNTEIAKFLASVYGATSFGG